MNRAEHMAWLDADEGQKNPPTVHYKLSYMVLTILRIAIPDMPSM